MSAELSASVNPQGGLVTECYFEYGTTPALGGLAPCATLPGGGEEYAKVGAAVSGLSPHQAYLVRIVAVNAGGEARGGEGEKHNFTTANGGEAPVITKVKPTKGGSAGGTKVVIVGEHFEKITAVDFGDAEATVVHSEVNKIEVTSPPGVGTVDITVSTEFGTSKITSADQYAYGKPQIASLVPNHGPKSGGTEVTVTGNGFELGQTATKFTFGKNAATSAECTSTTTCIVVAPPNIRVKGVKVQATVNGKKSPNQNDAFQYEP